MTRVPDWWSCRRCGVTESRTHLHDTCREQLAAWVGAETFTTGDTRTEQILNLRRTGATLADIAHRFHVTPERVRQILKQHTMARRAAAKAESARRAAAHLDSVDLYMLRSHQTTDAVLTAIARL